MTTKKEGINTTYRIQNIYIAGFDALRGFFMLIIFLFHMHLNLGGGALGVTFFFIMSGLSMTLGYKELVLSGGITYKDFLYKRLAKLIPLHLLTLLFAIVLELILIVSIGFEHSFISRLLANFFLVQSWIPIPSYFLSFNSVSWYLCDTLFFIYLFPALIKYSEFTKRGIQLVIAVVLLLLYLVLVISLPHELYYNILYVNPIVRLLDFMAGMYLGRFMLKFTASNRCKIAGFTIKNFNFTRLVVFFVISILVVESEMLYDSYRFISIVYWPLLFIMLFLVFLISSNESCGERFLIYKVLIQLGKISFTFYMIHQLVYKYSYNLFHYLFHADNIWILAPFVLIISIILALFLNNYFVKPISNKLLSKLKSI